MIGRAEAPALRRHPHNAVHLVLPEGSAPERYERAAERLREWRERGVLEEEDEAAVFVYRQRFRLGEERLSRWSLLAALELAPFEAGSVLPHEETHAAPREDRLALTLACRAQLSAVFLTAEDPNGRLREGLREAGGGSRPIFEGETPDGVGHALWRATGAGAGDLCEAAGVAPLLIADGHHRYETALAVRERLADAWEARRVLACIASETDPGLRIFPTHRAVPTGPPSGAWAAALAEAFRLDPLPASESGAEAVAARVGTRAPPGKPIRLGLWLPGGGGHLLVPRPEALPGAGAEGSVARIPSVVFDRLVVRRILSLDADGAARHGLLSYHRDPVEAAEAAGERGAAFLLPPVGIRDVRRVAASGRRLPPKSTYFAPKIPSGLVFRRI